MGVLLGLLLPAPHGHDGSQHIGWREGLLGSVRGHYVLCGSERDVKVVTERVCVACARSYVVVVAHTKGHRSFEAAGGRL